MTKTSKESIVQCYWCNVCRETFTLDPGHMLVHTVLASGPDVKALPLVNDPAEATPCFQDPMAQELLRCLAETPPTPDPTSSFSEVQHFPALSLGSAFSQAPKPDALTVYGNVGVHGHVTMSTWSNWSDQSLKSQISPYCDKAMIICGDYSL